MFRLLLLCSSFRLESSCFSVFAVSIIALGICCLDSLFIFGIFLIFHGQKTNLYFRPYLVSESLACSLKSNAFFQNFNYSFPIASL